MLDCAEDKQLSELKEKLSTSLDSLEKNRQTLQSINESLSALQEADLSQFLDSIIASRPEVGVIIPRENHRNFISQLEKLCYMRRHLNEYKAKMDALASLNVDYIVRLLREKLEREQAKHQELLTECHRLQSEHRSLQ